MLRIDRLRLTWGSFTLSADLTVAKGASVAVIGQSGAGKSTLLAAIAGFAPPGEGAILWDGAGIDGLPPWQRPVAMLFQDSNLFPHLTVARNVALALNPRRRPTVAEQARVTEMLARVGLGGLGDRRPGQLSGGQQSRAALARVLLMDRPLVLLDEPFAALGPGLKDEMLALAAEMLREAGRTLLLVTHDPDEARAVADGIIIVADGEATGPHPVSALDDPPPALAAWLGK